MTGRIWVWNTRWEDGGGGEHVIVMQYYNEMIDNERDIHCGLVG